MRVFSICDYVHQSFQYLTKTSRTTKFCFLWLNITACTSGVTAFKKIYSYFPIALKIRLTVGYEQIDELSELVWSYIGRCIANQVSRSSFGHDLISKRVVSASLCLHYCLRVIKDCEITKLRLRHYWGLAGIHRFMEGTH